MSAVAVSAVAVAVTVAAVAVTVAVAVAVGDGRLVDVVGDVHGYLLHVVTMVHHWDRLHDGHMLHHRHVLHHGHVFDDGHVAHHWVRLVHVLDDRLVDGLHDGHLLQDGVRHLLVHRNRHVLHYGLHLLISVNSEPLLKNQS